jgi:CDP-paratose 2-epimerase
LIHEKTARYWKLSCLIGSEVVARLSLQGWKVYGVDNNMRADFFGPQGDSSWNTMRLSETWADFTHRELDIRDRSAVLQCLEETRPDMIVHTAAHPQPWPRR